MDKIYVIAGNRQQADDWVKNDLRKRASAGTGLVSWSDYYVVGIRDQLRGIKDPHGVFIGTWRDRKDTVEILAALMGASNDSARMQTIMNEWLLTRKVK